MKRGIAYMCAALLGIGAGAVCSSAFAVTTVTDDAMAPFLFQGEHVMLDLFASGKKAIVRGDVVVLRTPLYMETGEDGHTLKRIIALPGEKVCIADGRIWINGRPLSGEPYDGIRIGNETMASRTVPDGRYFVLGDNLIKSTDSRDVTVGMVRVEDILGKVIIEW